LVAGFLPMNKKIMPLHETLYRRGSWLTAMIYVRKDLLTMEITGCDNVHLKYDSGIVRHMPCDRLPVSISYIR